MEMTLLCSAGCTFHYIDLCSQICVQVTIVFWAQTNSHGGKVWLEWSPLGLGDIEIKGILLSAESFMVRLFLRWFPTTALDKPESAGGLFSSVSLLYMSQISCLFFWLFWASHLSDHLRHAASPHFPFCIFAVSDWAPVELASAFLFSFAQHSTKADSLLFLLCCLASHVKVLCLFYKYKVQYFWISPHFCLLLCSWASLHHPTLPVVMHLMFCFRLREMQEYKGYLYIVLELDFFFGVFHWGLNSVPHTS
jgi:hypothetical protein